MAPQNSERVRVRPLACYIKDGKAQIVVSHNTQDNPLAYWHIIEESNEKK